MMMKKLTIFFVLLLSLGKTWGQGVKPELRIQLAFETSFHSEIIILPDGKSFLVEGSGVIIQFDLVTAKEIKRFPASEFITFIGNKYLFTRELTKIQCWDLENGKEINSFEGNTILPLSDDESFLVIYEYHDDKIEHHDLESGKKKHTFRGENIVLLPNKTHILIKDDNEVEYWSLESGKKIQTFSVDVLAIGTRDTHEEIRVILNPHNSNSFFSMSASALRYVDDDGFIVQKEGYGILSQWSLLSGKKIQTYKTQFPYKCDILFMSKNQKSFFTLMNDEIKHWDLEKDKEINSFKGDIILPLSDGKSFLVENENKIEYWNLESGKKINTFNVRTSIYEIILLPDNQSFLIVGNGIIIHYNLESGKKINTFNVRTSIYEIILLPDNQSFLIVGHRIIIHYDLESGKKINTFNMDDIKNKITLLPDNKSFLAIGSKLQHWDLKNGVVIKTFEGEAAEVDLHNFNGRFCLIEVEGNLKIFDFLSASFKTDTFGVQRKYLEVDNFEKNDTLLLPNNKCLLNRGSKIEYWNLQDNKVINTFEGHKHDIEEIILLPSNQSFLTYCEEQNIPNEHGGVEHHGYGDGTDYYYALEEYDTSLKHWDLKSGREINTFDIGAWVDTLILSPNGKSVLVISQVLGSRLIEYWDLEKGKEINSFKGGIILPLSDGKSFLVENENKIEYWNLESGKEINTFNVGTFINEIILLPDNQSFLAVGDGIVIHYNLESGKKTNTFNVGTSINEVILLPDNQSFLAVGYGIVIHYDLESGKKTNTFNVGTSINEIILLPDNQSFLTRSNIMIKHWSLKTGVLLGVTTSYLDIQSISFSSDYGKLITRDANRDLVLYDLKNHKKVCTLIFKKGNNKDFVITTPDNYYFATKGGVNDLVHYVIGDEVYLFSQFDLQYNRPDIVLERIGLASDTLIQTYRLAYQKRLEKMGFSEKRIKLFMNRKFDKDFNAPEIELVGKGNFVFEESTQSEYTFSFTATDAKYNIERIFVNVDGVPLYGAKGIILENPSQNLAETKIKVPLAEGENIITLSVINAQGVASLEKRLEITYNPPQPTKPTLYVFSIGVNEYQDEDITKLDYAVKDAEKVVEIFAQNKGNFAAVKNFTLTDAEVNKNSVLKLRQELLKTNPEDMVIFNFAGHGFLDDSTNYYLGTYDTDLNNLAQTGLKYDAVESLLDGIPARKKLMFIDACHSGEVDKESVKGFQENKRTRKWTRNDGKIIEVNELSQTAFEVMKTSFSDLRIGTGTTVISASGGLEAATEDYTWGHGAFTYTLIQGLQEKKADLDKNGKITVSELQTYLAEEVQRLTDGFQKPTSRIENIVNDFVVWE